MMLSIKTILISMTSKQVMMLSIKTILISIDIKTRYDVIYKDNIDQYDIKHFMMLSIKTILISMTSNTL